MLRLVVINALMRTMAIVLLLNDFDSMVQLACAYKDEIIQSLPGFANESFGKGVAYWHTRGSFNDSDVLGFYSIVKRQKGFISVVYDIAYGRSIFIIVFAFSAQTYPSCLPADGSGFR